MRGEVAAGMIIAEDRVRDRSPRVADAGSDEISGWDLRRLRDEIRKNRVTFPSEVPVFSKLSRPEIQWRIVLL